MLFSRRPHRFPHCVPDGLRAVEPVHHAASKAQAVLADSSDFGSSSFRRRRRDISYSDKPSWIIRTKLGDEIVIGAIRDGDNSRILDAVLDEADTVNNLRVNTI